ncbi:hypothetical protein [Proteus terrae]|uniref:hypothetical protein n=1 Tax=Proteus terrae TaxID=1574161 RepID=UPI00298D541F|nr:hypothetical protein [Proteus terrae]WPD00874.1 hypothetical protein R5P25_10275 [Proteus terrae]
MNNKEITLDQMYSMIKRGYISKFPHPFEQYKAMILYFFNHEAEKYNYPIKYKLSNSYNEKDNPVFSEHIVVEKIIEEVALLSADEQEKVIKKVADLNNDITNIINDLEALHRWLINEGLVKKEAKQFHSTKYHMTKEFMELERIPL